MRVTFLLGLYVLNNLVERCLAFDSVRRIIAGPRYRGQFLEYRSKPTVSAAFSLSRRPNPHHSSGFTDLLAQATLLVSRRRAARSLFTKAEKISSNN